MTIGKGLFMSLVLGLLSTLSASGADLLQVASFSTVLTEIAQQVGGDHMKLPWRGGSGRISLAQIESSLERLATSMVVTR
jgi:hypothetical protein